MNDIYVVAYVDENDTITGFPKGGGSSTKPSIKAHDKLSSAKRAARFFPGSSVVRATSFEIVKEDE